MTSSSLSSPGAPTRRRWPVPDTTGFGLIRLRGAASLEARLLPGGALHALRHEGTLINQVLPGPAEEGLFRLLLRSWDGEGIAGGAPLAGPGLDFAATGGDAAVWRTETEAGLRCTTTLRLDPRETAWSWRVRLHNGGAETRSVDVLHAQDLGLGDEGAVRNNEAYTSQYIDFLPVSSPALGWTLLVRQNQAMAGGRHPWLALACLTGAEAYCTDGRQFFGADHRLTGEPVALRMPALPSRRLQHEFALGGLQSRRLTLAPGAEGEIVFVARFLPDHPAASAVADLDRLRGLGAPAEPAQPDAGTAAAERPPSVFVSAPWLHGDRAGPKDWAAWFPGERRHEETDAAGVLQSFFNGEATHVITRDKEAAVDRPHGHILRSGDGRWIDDGQFGITCYAAGVFGAQAYLGNPGLVRLLPVVRNALGLMRAGGQRVFLRREGAWRQLGVPSAFAVTPGLVRWIYRCGADVVEARVWCARARAASFLELRVVEGPPAEFLVTHELALGANEFDHTGEAGRDAEAGLVWCRPGPDSLPGQHLPEVAFAIAAADPDRFVEIGGDELLYPDGAGRDGPYVVLRTHRVRDCGVILLGVCDGVAGLARAAAAAREEFPAGARAAAEPPPSPVRLTGPADPAVARVDEVLPWFTHNASIHFSAPHGLEQSGGGAWGVRDVCQGSLEWLLAAGEHGAVRRMLATVFGQQYARDGAWPQWFMPPPFRHIQQAHSHGDICFWPVKALCDYAEAADDLAFLESRAAYTDPETFDSAGPEESLWDHCERVVAHGRARFLAGTALVDYGDGDWDDTLQPADPAMRRRLVSAWTVGLAYQTFRQFAGVCRRAGRDEQARRLEDLGEAMRRDFAARLTIDGVVAGFLVFEDDGTTRPLLHPADRVTGIRYRLLPMTRAILAGLFTPGEARRHLDLIARELTYPDGVRLMSEPAAYHGGCERLFRRAETAANVGREIGLQYVHAHLRYAEALARVGDADGLWAALQVVNPVGLAAVVPQAAPRQSNVYFSSSDAAFADREEAAARWPELRTGRVAVHGGWRLYSSGPGLFVHKVRSCLLGLRESFGDVVFDPVLPRSLDGLKASAVLAGRRVELCYRVGAGSRAPRAITVNGVRCEQVRREPNPYREGGLVVSRAVLRSLLHAEGNRIEIDL